jgi:hypothetical protein
MVEGGYLLAEVQADPEDAYIVQDMPMYYLAVPSGYSGSQQAYQLVQPAAGLAAEAPGTLPALGLPSAHGVRLSRAGLGPLDAARPQAQAYIAGSSASGRHHVLGLPQGQHAHPPGLLQGGYMVVPVLPVV